MAGGNDDTVSGATIADRPGAKALVPRPRTVTSEPASPGEVLDGGVDTPALLYAVVHITPLRPSAFGPVPPQVEAFLQISLAEARDTRFESGAELATAFAAARGGSLLDLLLRRARKLGRELPWTAPEIAEHKAS